MPTINATGVNISRQITSLTRGQGKKKFLSFEPTKLFVEPQFNSFSGMKMMRLPAYNATTNTSMRVYTQSEPAMSEEDFEAAIVAMAQRDAGKGNFQSRDKEYLDLLESYTSVVSPDRKGAVESAANKWMVPSNAGVNAILASIKDGAGKEVSIYSQVTGWNHDSTRAELDRMGQFLSIYNKAFFAAQKGSEATASSGGTTTSVSVSIGVSGDSQKIDITV